MALIIFVLCITLRAIPELTAYPYPIGYDVVNYYIPTVANIGEKWSSIASQFPLYVLLLDLIKLLTGFSAQSVVVGMSIAMAGFFGISLYYIGRTILKLGIAQSAFLALFVIIQVSTLRTMWDLHKDIFALTTMMFALSLIARKNTTFWIFVLTIALATLTVSMDKMIGILFCFSLAIYSIMTRRKRVIQITALSTVLFFLLMLTSYETSQITSAVSKNSIPESTGYEFYNPTNLTILFIVLSGFIAVPAAIGFFAMKNNLLKIPLIVSLIGSLSWLLVPHDSSLAADRWIILASIFLSVFAGYGILHLVKNLRLRCTAIVTGSIVGAFAVIGMAYSVMPYDSPFILYGAVSSNTGKFIPPTMQFNSLDIKDNHNLISTIAWLNENTEQDSIIVGEKHWRGFMDVYLKDARSYKSSDYPSRTAEALSEQGMHVYLISVVDGPRTNFDIKVMSKR